MKRSGSCAASAISEVTVGHAESASRSSDPSRRWLNWLLATVALFASLALNFHHLGARSLAGDEAIYANPARFAAVDGHWYPLRSQRPGPYHSKPPLMSWPVALSFAIGGVSETTDRVPSALAGAVLVAVVAAFAGWLFGPWTGLLAGLLLAANPLWLGTHGARDGVGEPLLVLLTTVALLSAMAYAHNRRRRWLLGALLAVMAASIIKGLFGPMMVGLILLAWGWTCRRSSTGQRGERAADRASSAQA